MIVMEEIVRILNWCEVNMVAYVNGFMILVSVMFSSVISEIMEGFREGVWVGCRSGTRWSVKPVQEFSSQIRIV